MSEFDHHRRMASRLAGPHVLACRHRPGPNGPAKVDAATAVRPPEDTGPSSPYLSRGEYLVGLAGLAVLRLGAAGRAELADRLIGQLGEFASRLHDAPIRTDPGWEVLDPRQGYARWADTYDDNGGLVADLEQAPMLTLLDSLPTDTGPILDVACGTGRYTAHLVGQGHSVIGVDITAEMLARAARRAPAARFVLGDLCALPLRTAAMAGAVCALALTHLPGLRPAARELARVVRPGGRAVISVPHPLAIQLLDFKAATSLRSGEHRLRVPQYPHSVSDYAAAFLASGWVIRQCLEPGISPAAAAAAAPRPEYTELCRLALAGLPAALVWKLDRSQEEVLEDIS